MMRKSYSLQELLNLRTKTNTHLIFSTIKQKDIFPDSIVSMLVPNTLKVPSHRYPRRLKEHMFIKRKNALIII